jgi:hypothetical protein
VPGLVISATVVAALASLLATHQIDGVVARLVLLTALCAAPIAIAIFRRGSDPLSPALLLAFAFFALYAVRAWSIRGDHIPFVMVTPRVFEAYGAYVTAALDLAIIAVAAFYAGYAWVVGAALARSFPRPRELIPHQGTFAAGVLLLLVGLPFFMVTALQNQGLFLANTQATAFGEVLVNGAALTLVGLALVGIGAFQTESASRSMRKAVFVLATAVVFAFALISDEKATILWTGISVAVAYHFGKRSLKPWHMLASFLVFALLLFPFVQEIRNDTRSSPDRPSIVSAVERAPKRIVQYEVFSGLPRQRFTPGDYISDAFNVFTTRLYGLDSLLVERALTPSVYPYLDGSTYARLPASFVPRAIWNDKPQLSLATWFGDRYWGRTSTADRSTQATTFAGEFYLNFGVVGVLFGMFLLGFLYRLWYAYLSVDWNVLMISLLVVTIPTMLLVEGDFVLLFRTMVNRVLTTFLALALINLVLRRVRERRRRAETVAVTA